MQRWLGEAREVTLGTGIESRRKPAMWRWASVAGDVADLVAALRVSRPGDHNGKLGQDMSGIEAKGSITVNRPVDAVFAYWQDLEISRSSWRTYSRLPDPAPRRR